MRSLSTAHRNLRMTRTALDKFISIPKEQKTVGAATFIKSD